MPDETVLTAVAKRLVPPKTMPERERQKQIRRALARVQRPLGSAAPRDSSARQTAAFAYKALMRAGDQLQAAKEKAGVRMAPKVGENLKAQEAIAAGSAKRAADPDAALEWIEAEIRYLGAYEAKIRADQAANLLHVPRGGYPAADAEILNEAQTRISALRLLADKITSQREGKLVDALANLRRAYTEH